MIPHGIGSSPVCQKCDEICDDSNDIKLRRLGRRIGMLAGAFNIVATYTAVTEFLTYLKGLKDGKDNH